MKTFSVRLPHRWTFEETKKLLQGSPAIALLCIAAALLLTGSLLMLLFVSLLSFLPIK
jgi:hypothetical protein